MRVRAIVATSLLLCMLSGCMPGCKQTPLEAAARRARQAVERCQDAYRAVYDDHRQGTTSTEALDKAKTLYRAAMGEAVGLGMALTRAKAQGDDNLNDAPLAQAIAQNTANLQVAAANILACKGGK